MRDTFIEAAAFALVTSFMVAMGLLFALSIGYIQDPRICVGVSIGNLIGAMAGYWVGVNRS